MRHAWEWAVGGSTGLVLPQVAIKTIAACAMQTSVRMRFYINILMPQGLMAAAALCCLYAKTGFARPLD
jgi:hypothetical protein